VVQTPHGRSARPDLLIGSRIGGYRVEAVIGRGGMGVVYRAAQIALERTVALKLIAPEISSHGGFRQRFETEAKVAASLDHPNVLPVYEAGEEEGLLFVSMRYVAGADLGTLLSDSGPLAPARAVAIVVQVAEALAAAHARGVIHRDIKPGNVLIEQRDGREHAYLADFGLAKSASVASIAATTGMLVGTIDYASPEQIRGDALSPSSDVYSLGCLLWEALRGHPPFAREDELAKLWAHMHEPPPPLDVRGLESFDAVLQRAMAKQPDDRFPSAHAFAEAVAAAGAHRVPPSSARRGRSRRLAAAALVAITAGAATAGFFAGKGTSHATVKSTVEVPGIARAGALALSFPSSWQRISVNPSIPGVTFRNKPLYLAPREHPASAGLVVGSTSAPGPTLLPKGLSALVAPEAVSRREVVRLGGYEALRYRFVHPRGFGRTLVLYALPAADTTTIACFAPPNSDALLRACESIATSLRILGAEATSLTPDRRYAAVLSSAFLKLSLERKRGLATLGAAKTRSGQIAAAKTIAAAYAATSMTLLSLRAPSAATGANEAIAYATARAAAAYRALAAAAVGGKLQLYAKARVQIRATELELRKSVERLVPYGYSLRALS
jgi:hypothetical protein